MAARNFARGRAAAVVTIGAIVLVALAAGRSSPPRSQPVTMLAPPVVQIISFDDTIGMLDTTSGAVYRLRGDLSNASVTHTWQLRVPAVAGPTSGYLEIQRATFNQPEATFLVDKVTGRTWILRRRASENGSWDPVTIQ
jgi:hypothetical protein